MELVYPYGTPLCSGQIKQQAEDFKVIEQLGFSLTGSGEHLFLYVQKINLTTHQLIEQLAKIVGIQPRNIGYSGLKDKHAITQQWISLHMPGCKHKPQILDTENYQILDSTWHDKKLRVGVHRSNIFDITIRNIKGQSDGVNDIIHQITGHGFANYFGEQRFGTQHDNVEQALRILNNRHKLKRLSRSKKSLYISSLRSELFNRILARRIKQDIWFEPVQGDVFILGGTQSVFSEPLNDEILQRYVDFDIHSAVSLYGAGESRMSGQAFDLEDNVINDYPDIKSTLIDLKIKRSLRANRAIAKKLQVNFQADQDVITVKVELEKGCYLTTLLSHFINLI